MERLEKMSLVLWNQLPTVEVSLDQVMLQMDGAMPVRLVMGQGDSTAHVCMEVVNKDTIDHYFSLLHDMLTIHGLFDKPS